MEFTTEKLLEFFYKKLEEAEQIDAENDEKSLDRWWSGVKRCGGLMGKEYSELLDDVRFHAGAYLMGEPELNRIADRDARKNGLEQAKNNIGKIIDDLNTFGYVPKKSTPIKTNKEKMINNVTVNNNQTSNMVVSIQDFAPETRKVIQELQAELTKKKKNKEMIKKLLVKLTETGIDALEKIFLHSIGI